MTSRQLGFRLGLQAGTKQAVTLPGAGMGKGLIRSMGGLSAQVGRPVAGTLDWLGQLLMGAGQKNRWGQGLLSVTEGGSRAAELAKQIALHRADPAVLHQLQPDFRKALSQGHSEIGLGAAVLPLAYMGTKSLLSRQEAPNPSMPTGAEAG